jgi:streptogramin lyase
LRSSEFTVANDAEGPYGVTSGGVGEGSEPHGLVLTADGDVWVIGVLAHIHA